MEHIMGLYEEGLEELMDAQKYWHTVMKSQSEDEKNMYKTLARQELDHAQMIIRDGDKVADKEPNDMIKMVWRHLRGHLLDWHSDLHNKLN